MTKQNSFANRTTAKTCIKKSVSLPAQYAGFFTTNDNSMKKRNKKYSADRKTRNTVIGLIVRWSDTSPDMDSSGFMPGEITHRKPLLRMLAPGLFSRSKTWIVEQQIFFWRVTLTVIFRYPNGTDQRETRELYAHTVLSDISEHSVEQFRDALRHGNEQHYTHTEFEVECLGTEPKDINETAA